MKNTDMFAIFKAIEFLTYGVDVSNFSYEQLKGFYNKRDKCYISRLSPNVTDFTIKLDDESKELIGVFNNYIFRHERNYKCLEESEISEVNVEVTKEQVVQIIQMLYKSGAATFEDVDEEILDTTLREKLQKIDETFDRKAPIDNDFINKLSNDKVKKYFDIMTSVSYEKYPGTLKTIVDAFNTKYTSFDIEGFKDYPIYDNRLFIPLSEADKYRIKKAMGDAYDSIYDELKYIVVSKNLYDYYYCSYGSEFQSCFSISSDHCGWFGMVPMGTMKDNYIIYATKDKAQKTSMDSSGSKWPSPYMYWRCWGWVSNDGKLLVDKTYTNRRYLFDVMKPLMESLGMSFEDADLRQGKEFAKFFNKVSCKFYPDSVKTRGDGWKFSRDNGTKSFVGENRPSFKDRYSSLKNTLTSIKGVADAFNPLLPCEVIDGVLCNPKICPMTGLKISGDSDKSYYAKFLIAPVNGFLALTYIDGCVKIDAMTSEERGRFMKCYCTNYSSKEFGSVFNQPFNHIPLSPLKEYLKGCVNNTPYDIILLRVVEEDKVTFIKYKKNGVK